MDDLWTLAESTILEPRMSYEMEVTSTIPGLESPFVNKTTGRYDDDSYSGQGSRLFESSIGEVIDDTGAFFGEPIELIVVDDVAWIGFPAANGWTGFDIFEAFEATGADFSALADSDAIVGAVVSAVIEVIDFAASPGGGATWTARVRADDLVAVVSAGGAAQRLIAAGAAATGLEAIVEIDESADGYINGIRSDLSEWWTAAIRLAAGDVYAEAGLQFESLTMSMHFSAETFEEPLALEAPCEDPEAVTDDDGLPMLRCED